MTFNKDWLAIFEGIMTCMDEFKSKKTFRHENNILMKMDITLDLIIQSVSQPPVSFISPVLKWNNFI